MGFDKDEEMKCRVNRCSGEYIEKQIIHTVKPQGKLIVIDHVPAYVCSICGDVLFGLETVRKIEKMTEDLPEPTKMAPVYEYA